MNVLLSPAQARNHDRRRQAVATATASAAAAGVATILVAHHATPWTASLIATAAVLGAWLGTLHSYTDADASGLRTRGVLRTRTVAWPDIQAMEAVTKSTRNGEFHSVAVRTTNSETFVLGAPKASRGWNDAEFNREFASLRRDWLAVKKPGNRTRPLQGHRITPSPHDTSRYVGAIAVLLALAGFAFVTAGMRPAWDAHLGHGTFGTFTVTSKECGKTCDYYGSFVGTAPNDKRSGVKLTDGTDLEVGSAVDAIDTGGADNVYSADGGNTWATESIIQALCCAFIGFLGTKLVVNPVRRRREQRLAAG